MAPPQQNSNKSADPADPVSEWLERSFWDAVGDDNLETLTWKPPGDSDKSTKANPSSKSNTLMANGQDFFAELRRQVSALAEKEKDEEKKRTEKQG